LQTQTHGLICNLPQFTIPNRDQPAKPKDNLFRLANR